jgi:uncharacterized protein YdeI (YjbR/CyaY-like superfamily)
MNRAKSVQEYIANSGQWENALILLREIILDDQLEETVKWGAPAYLCEGKNIIGIAGFKAYVGLWFHQGALLSDPDNKLINAQEGKTKSLRQWRFQSAEEIEADAPIIHKYIKEAIANQKAGKAIKSVPPKTLSIPPELKAALAADKTLDQHFRGFTPGKRREFAEYISEAKRPATKQKRLEKITPMILKGEGMSDRYRK